MKRTIALAGLMSLSTLALGGPDLSGTYKRDAAKEEMSSRRHAPIAIVVIVHTGDKLGLQEKSATDHLIQSYECTLGGACENFAGRSKTKFPGQARWEGNQLVLLSESTGTPQVIRRYALSEDGKTLVLKEQDRRQENVEFHRE
jgi:hypothetical protein